ncbi:MAG: hypothetical protein IKA24_07105 [Mogibacterium sp.]|nr:hypothetical protein [Mogibacterium sp.]
MSIDIDEFAKSQCALRDYMHYKPGNECIHKARVLVSSKGDLKFSAEMVAFPRIETNYSTISITQDANNVFERDYYSQYSNEYQEFSFVNGTLRIKGDDRWGNPVEINITAI